MNWTGIAAVELALAVILGAFGAHGLRDRLDAYSMNVYERAVFYQFVHSLGLLIVSVLPKFGIITPDAAGWIGGLLVAGVVLFSGSLYVLAVSGVRILGAVTPFGGLCFIAAWVYLAFAAFRARL